VLNIKSIPGQARTDRVATIEIVAIDWNSLKYITSLHNGDTINELFEKSIGR